VISPSDPSSAWTAKANKRVQSGYGLNYLIDIDEAVIVDVEATPARTYDEVAATKTMLDRRSLLRPEAEAAGRRHGLRHRQVPGLARQGEEDYAAHPRLGAPQARRWHLQHFGLPMGRATRRLHLSKRQAAQNQWNRALGWETALNPSRPAIARRPVPS
jgi:hypothetical protein